MDIKFTKHAIEKIRLLEKYGFKVSLNMVIDTINNPVRVDRRGNQYLAVKPIDEIYALRVVYEVRENIKVIITLYPVRRGDTVYKIKYDPDADVVLLIFEDKGSIDYADEAGDMIIHYGKDGKIIMIEILNASRVISKLVETLAKKEAIVS